jgi:TolB-like protein
MTEPSKAVFLSYASQDAAAAHRLAEGLRAGGVEVWLDTTGLRGGDAWDRQIKQQIRDCALFLPIISVTTQERDEGYFRREWRQAVDRTHDMAGRATFLIPVVIDDTDDREAEVPDEFRCVQWTRLRNGETSTAFVERVRGLLQSKGARIDSSRPISILSTASAPAAPSREPSASASTAPKAPVKLLPKLLAAIVGAAALAVGYIGVMQFKSRQPAVVATVTAPLSAPTTVAEQSVAVLPFVNESSDKEQEYFADGLTETMIDLLSKVPDLHVAARTSSFYFKDKSERLPVIAKELNVANVLEGSVRKAANRLRITARLVQAVNGYQLWSETYDRDTKDIFKVQDEISAAVVTALKLKLVAPAAVAADRGTTNTAAYNQYLIAKHLDRLYTLDGYRRALEAYEKALSIDPHYEIARAASNLSRASIADQTGDGPGLTRAIAEMQEGVTRAPDQAWAYRYRGIARTQWLWDYAGAKADFQKAIALAPTEPLNLQDYGTVLETLGQFEAAIEVTKKSLDLDPLATDAMANIAQAQLALRDFPSAEASLVRALQLTPDSDTLLGTSSNPGMAALRLLQGRPEEALTFCQRVTDERIKIPCIAQAEYSAGHKAEAENALAELLKTGATGNTYAIAQTYAWRGEADKAFEWFDKVVLVRDAGVSELLADRQLDSLHKDPRWKALLKKVNLLE